MPLSNKLQELVDRISRQREKLLQSVSGLSEAQLNHKAEETAWSVGDVVNHVALADEASVKLTSILLKRARENKLPPDLSPEASQIHAIDEILPRLNAAKFRAPEFVAPHSQVPVDESLKRLESSRQRVLANVEDLGEYDLSALTHPHPAAGELNAYQWILMAGFHESRHADQINRMKSHPGFPE